MDGQREQRALVDEPMVGVGGPACNDGKPCYYAHIPAARAPKDATYPLHGRAQHLNPDVRVGGRQWRISVARWGGRCWRGRRQRHRGHGRRGGLGRWWWRWRHSVGLHDRHWWWRRWRQSTHRALHLNEPPATRQSRRARAAAVSAGVTSVFRLAHLCPAPGQRDIPARRLPAAVASLRHRRLVVVAAAVAVAAPRPTLRPVQVAAALACGPT